MLPFEIAVRITSAKLGPGDAAPAKRVNIKSIQESEDISLSIMERFTNAENITAFVTNGP